MYKFATYLGYDICRMKRYPLFSCEWFGYRYQIVGEGQHYLSLQEVQDVIRKRLTVIVIGGE